MQVGPDQNGPDQFSSGKVSVSEEIVNNHIDKVQFVSFRFLDITCIIVVKGSLLLFRTFTLSPLRFYLQVHIRC